MTTNPYTIINACRGGNYILFNTNSSQPTREWNRAETSGRLYCCSPALANCVDPVQLAQKRKMTVLKYSNDNNQGPGSTVTSNKHTQIGNFSSGTTNRNLSRDSSSSIQIGNVIYPIPEKILAAINQGQAAGTIPSVLTPYTLKQYIKKFRVTLNIPNTDPDILLKKVPLSQYKARYVYKAGGNKWPVNSDNNPVYLSPRNFPTPFKLGDSVSSTLVDVYLALSGLTDNMITGSLVSGDAQYVTVIRNNTCEYTGTLSEMYPATTDAEALTSASVWGSTIIGNSIYSQVSSDSVVGGGIFNVAIMTPANARRYAGKYRSRIGIIIGLTGQHMIDNKVLLSNLVSDACTTCTTSHLPTPSSSCTTGTTDYGTGCAVSSSATDFIDRIIACIQESVKVNSEIIFIPIMTDIQKMITESIPKGTLVTFPKTLSEPITTIDISNFNDYIYSYFSKEDGDTQLTPGLVNRIAYLTNKLATWKSNPSSLSLSDSIKQLLCCPETWACLNKTLCECTGESSTACTTYSTDCP